MDETDDLQAARAMRRAMLGDAYVDGQLADPNPTLAEFQDYLTSMAWGVWTRGGGLSPRDRSLLVLAMTAALGRMEEFRLHASAQARTGVTDDELDELLFQVAAYCGAPAGIAAKRALQSVRAERPEPAEQSSASASANTVSAPEGRYQQRPSGAGTRVGFVGLGNMGSVLAANLVGAGFEVVAHDVAGPGRVPKGATFAASLDDLAAACEVVVLSLPDGAASQQVTEALAAATAPDRHVTDVVDTSTIGVQAAQDIAAKLAAADLGYVDAPVSGGIDGARARTLNVMVAGPDDACARVEPVLAGLSDRRQRVGDRPGMAQALKLANNFLSATALAATSEAIAFGQSVGLDMATMLDALSASSGRNTATSDKFPNHVVTGRYASGFANNLMAKDLRLYQTAVDEQASPGALGSITAAIWERFAADEPGVDFTRIFPYVEAE